MDKNVYPQTSVDKPLKSVMHGQCDARPTVTFPAAEHHRPLAGTKLYCSVTEAHVCEQLAQGRYLVAGNRTHDLLNASFAVRRGMAGQMSTKPCM